MVSGFCDFAHKNHTVPPKSVKTRTPATMERIFFMVGTLVLRCSVWPVPRVRRHSGTSPASFAAQGDDGAHLQRALRRGEAGQQPGADEHGERLQRLAHTDVRVDEHAGAVAG